MFKTSSLHLPLMKVPTWAKIGIVALGAGIAYRLYQLWQLGDRITYSPRGVKFSRNGSNFFIDVDFSVNNPTKTTVEVKGIEGRIYIGDNLIAGFTGEGKTIQSGDNTYKTSFQINNKGTAISLLESIATKKWPVFSVSMKTILPLFSVNDDFDINTQDYADQIKSSLLSNVA